MMEIIGIVVGAFLFVSLIMMGVICMANKSNAAMCSPPHTDEDKRRLGL